MALTQAHGRGGREGPSAQPQKPESPSFEHLGRNRQQNATFLRQSRRKPTQISEVVMIGWALTFLLVALVAAVFGFGGIAGTAVEIAKLIFFVAIVLFAISAVIGLLRGRSPTI
jgi:uncharacterized membrane protein YtjA (UPF0391 family)